MNLCACKCGRTARRTYIKGHNGRTPFEVRFWDKVTGGSFDECWIWMGSTDGRGYGQINVDGRPEKAHRVAWCLLRGEIPTGLTVDHLCYTPLCQNPWHMDLVSRAENSRRVRANQHAGKTHCVNGHEFTPENTYRLERDRRSCRECANQAAYRSRYGDSWRAKYAARTRRQTTDLPA